MFGSEVLDVAIGLVFIYLVLSLICSAACELIESFWKRRAQYLRRGLQELFDDRDGTGLVREIYNHPLVNSLFRGRYEPGQMANLPSYIPSRNFALALMDIIGPGNPAGQPGGTRSGASGATMPSSVPAASPTFSGTGTGSYSTGTLAAETLRNAIVTNLSSNPQAKQALLTLADAAGYDPVKVRENIEAWYNSSMDRVSGWFKRTSHLTILTLGFLLSLAINADTIGITNSLATDKALRASLVSAAAESAKRPDGAQRSQQSAAWAPGTAPVPGTASPQSAASAPGTASPQSAPGSASDFAAQATILPDELTRNIPACQVDPNSPDCRFQSNLRQIRNAGLPLGWVAAGSGTDPRRVPNSSSDWMMKMLGIGLTALAISLGGPFWFDTLNRLMVVRSTVKPKEKSADEPSKN